MIADGERFQPGIQQRCYIGWNCKNKVLVIMAAGFTSVAARRIPTRSMGSPLSWTVLASALNRQLYILH